MDGTLLDSMRMWTTVFTEYVKSKGFTPTERQNRAFLEMTDAEAAVFMKKEFGLSDSVEKICSDLDSTVEKFYIEDSVLKPGAAELLELLKSRGVRMCILTSTDRVPTEYGLRHTGIRDYFCEVLACSDYGSGKDRPFVFEKALEVLGTKKEETPVFEDALYSIRTAKSCGFPVMAVLDEVSRIDWPEIKKLSDEYADSPKNLIPKLHL